MTLSALLAQYVFGIRLISKFAVTHATSIYPFSPMLKILSNANTHTPRGLINKPYYRADLTGGHRKLVCQQLTRTTLTYSFSAGAVSACVCVSVWVRS